VQLCLHTEGGRVRFAYDQLETVVTPQSRFLSVCHATGTVQIEELRNWRGVFLRRLETAANDEQPRCQTVFADEQDDMVKWSEGPGRLPSYCRYERDGDHVVCGVPDGSVLTRRQGAAPRPDDDACAPVSAVLAAGVLPDERVAQWRQLDADHCAGASRDVVTAGPAAPLPPGSLAISGCYAHALSEDSSETLCFEPGGATATRLLRTRNLWTCTSPIVPEQSSPPWQFQFTLVWRCAFSDIPDQRTAERSPFLTTRYCGISADGQLTCAYTPRTPGFVYARPTGG
jgi:hypothetical protein